MSTCSALASSFPSVSAKLPLEPNLPSFVPCHSPAFTERRLDAVYRFGTSVHPEMLTVTVKWGKQKFENIELDTAEPVEVFKAQLYALTAVPPERQKIMGVKGGFVKVRSALHHDVPSSCSSHLRVIRTFRTTPSGRA
eukprot:scaffold12068_cov32-Tisochrysis_lutea.AAC.1